MNQPHTYTKSHKAFIIKLINDSKSVFTHAVADASVFDDVVAVQDAEGVDFFLEIVLGRLLVGLQLLHSNQLTSVVTQWVITTKFNTAKVSLEKVGVIL